MTDQKLLPIMQLGIFAALIIFIVWVSVVI